MRKVHGSPAGTSTVRGAGLSLGAGSQPEAGEVRPEQWQAGKDQVRGRGCLAREGQ